MNPGNLAQVHCHLKTNCIMNRWGIIAFVLVIALAIWAILRFKPASGSLARGEKLYVLHCLNCHGENGEGLAKLIPPIHRPEMCSDAELVCAIRYGKKGEIEVGGILFDGEMPPNFNLDEGEIRDLANFIRIQLRNCPDCKEFELAEIPDYLSKCSLAQPL